MCITCMSIGGHLHTGGRAAFGRLPACVETIMVDEQAEDTANKYAQSVIYYNETQYDDIHTGLCMGLG